MHVYLPIHEYIVVHVFCSLNVISYKAIYLYTTYIICMYIIHTLNTHIHWNILLQWSNIHLVL